MKRKWFIIGISGIIIIIFGFNITNKLIGKDFNDNYHIGMPDELDAGLIDFLLKESVTNAKLIRKSDDSYTYASFNNEGEPMKMEYYTFKINELADYFSTIIDSEEPANTLKEFRSNIEKDLFKNPTNQYKIYPEMKLSQENNLTIRTEEGEKSFDLVEELDHFNLKAVNTLSLNVQSANDDSLSITIKNHDEEGQNKFIGMYMNQDFSNLTIVSMYQDYFHEQLEDGTLDDFKHLIFETEINNQYVLLDDKLRVYDKLNNDTFILSNGEDYIGLDNKYVYINGNDFDVRYDKKHRIQRIEDYLEGNNELFAEFELDYEEMSDVLGIDSVGAGLVNVVFMNDKYAVLHVGFSGAITGTAGSTNVIIDFQENREDPTIYLVDLDILLNTN